MEENSPTAEEIQELNRGIDELLRNGVPLESDSITELWDKEALILKALELANPRIALTRLSNSEQRSIHNMLKALRERIGKVLDKILVEG